MKKFIKKAKEVHNNCIGNWSKGQKRRLLKDMLTVNELDTNGNRYIGSFYSEVEECVIHILISGYSDPIMEYMVLSVNGHELLDTWFTSKDKLIEDYNLVWPLATNKVEYKETIPQDLKNVLDKEIKNFNQQKVDIKKGINCHHSFTKGRIQGMIDSLHYQGFDISDYSSIYDEVKL